MNDKTTTMHFRVTAREKRAIQRAAKRAGMTVSVWLRMIANAAIGMSA